MKIRDRKEAVCEQWNDSKWIYRRWHAAQCQKYIWKSFLPHHVLWSMNFCENSIFGDSRADTQCARKWCRFRWCSSLTLKKKKMSRMCCHCAVEVRDEMQTFHWNSMSQSMDSASVAVGPLLPTDTLTTCWMRNSGLSHWDGLIYSANALPFLPKSSLTFSHILGVATRMVAKIMV